MSHLGNCLYIREKLCFSLYIILFMILQLSGLSTLIGASVEAAAWNVTVYGNGKFDF
jgi:hypothetical protein